MFRRTQTPTDGNMQTLQQNIEELKCMVTENRHILNGRDGSPGLVGNFALLKEELSGLKTLLTNDLAHMSARMDLMFNSRDNVSLTKEQLTEQLQLERDRGKLSSGEILKDWVKPVITSIITAILVYFIVTSGIGG